MASYSPKISDTGSIALINSDELHERNLVLDTDLLYARHYYQTSTELQLMNAGTELMTGIHKIYLRRSSKVQFINAGYLFVKCFGCIPS